VSGTTVRLVASAPTVALRHAVFGGDDDLDPGGLTAARVLADPPTGRAPLRRPAPDRPEHGATEHGVCSPARAARQTAGAAGRRPTVVAALADCDYGRWDGRTLGDVLDAEPAAVRAWLTDPGAAPHGGESFTDVLTRVGAWLDGEAGTGRRLVAFTHAVVIRAALVHALGLPPASFRRLDVAPLSVTRLRFRSGTWTLHLPAYDG
jgi:broad specificity phosphatase PhoE